MYWVYFLVLLGPTAILVYGNPQLTSSIPFFSGELCPQNVTLTCNANFSDGTIIYFGSNDTIIASHIYKVQDMSNIPVSVESPIENVTAQIAEITMANGRFIFSNFTLSADLSDMTQFEGQEISCGTHSTRSNPIRISSYNISELPSIHEGNINTYYTVMYSADGRIGTIHVESNYSSSSTCDIDISYSIEIRSSNERKMCSTTDSCINDKCSADCTVSTTNSSTIYEVLVTATSSPIRENLTSSMNLNSSIDISRFLNSCDHSIMCPNIVDGNCKVMYGSDENYELFQNQLFIQPNMTQQLSIKDSQDIYYALVMFHINSSRITIQLRYELGQSNGIAVHFIVPGIITLVLGLLFFVAGVVVALTYIKKGRTKDHCCFLIGGVLGIIEFLIFVLSLVLWIVYFGYISTDDCGIQTRDSSIAIAAMFTSFLLLIISPLMFSGFCFSDNGIYRQEPESEYEFKFGKDPIVTEKEQPMTCRNSPCENSLQTPMKYCHACGKYICNACVREAYIQRIHKVEGVCSKCIEDYNEENERLLRKDSIRTISNRMSDGSRCWVCKKKNPEKSKKTCYICNQKACLKHLYTHQANTGKLCGKCHMLKIRKDHAME